MAIHAPAHRPPVHFHVTWPHLGDAAQGIVSALVVIALIVAVGAVATVVSTIRRKGVISGSLDTGLNATPVVGALTCA